MNVEFRNELTLPVFMSKQRRGLTIRVKLQANRASLGLSIVVVVSFLAVQLQLAMIIKEMNCVFGDFLWMSS